MLVLAPKVGNLENLTHRDVQILDRDEILYGLTVKLPKYLQAK